ncbi:hypothetical protein SAMN06893096_106200 [Geodermatophilus pulveris]|uniref:Uncharacterized protein n=1 Tax=Geodermatophilus pulveris TaxID=1564159 RepID=A0A239GJ24_9ACTN|nr:hypothetical protein [Geodermatophilus pulveris]SNS68493.1 hypothetical protein SAMN06893096_106200 [Geodermatophilus pulveris]
MSTRGLLHRLLLGLGAVAVGVLVVAGGLALRPPGLVAVGMAAVVAASLVAGVSRDSLPGPAEVVDVAWKAGAATVVALLALCGAAVLGGSVLTLLLAGAAALAGTVTWLVRAHRAPAPSAPAAARRPSSPRPVSALATDELGREWTRTSAALAGRLDAATRAAIVARREETLDELERRDPEGFARWIAGLPVADSDPGGELRHGDPAP